MHSTKFLYIITGFFLLASVGVLVFLVARGVSKPQNATPSQAVGTTTDPTICQGNPNAAAKCFKCETGANKNNPVGILDFQCFRNFYGQNVGK